MWEKIKAHKDQLFYVLVVILTGLLGFGLGRLSKIEEGREMVRVLPSVSSGDSGSLANPSSSTSWPKTAQYVASKSGTKYHLPWCSGAQRIKEENKIFFASKEEAERAGYQPASNCQGI